MVSDRIYQRRRLLNLFEKDQPQPHKEVVAERIEKTDDYFFGGTFPPASFASLIPMAMACFLLFTWPPLPSLPDFKSPSLNSFITSPIFSRDFLEYFAITLCFKFYKTEFATVQSFCYAQSSYEALFLLPSRLALSILIKSFCL